MSLKILEDVSPTQRKKKKKHFIYDRKLLEKVPTQISVKTKGNFFKKIRHNCLILDPSVVSPRVLLGLHYHFEGRNGFFDCDHVTITARVGRGLGLGPLVTKHIKNRTATLKLQNSYNIFLTGT